MKNQEKLLKKKLVSFKFSNEKLETELKTARFIQTELQHQSEEKDEQINLL